ncbi:zinc finger BED domain-containing protein 4-like [Acyrthosiphon pisum]|uniref:Zinc finger BED domain-containing protein 4 n=1 Tax=Acyrthosiphon pisum TaxID=7029 RepID=A0A8R1X2Q3_ACYPI|nr:zinc finger BED domain-containing protein 4-like [Acyrthosiphon pisum]|eukprot:XP_008178492.1 PREDICTED: zinc finger BED domain-containing protein 4-like [Acyrthosiphon pisum]
MLKKCRAIVGHYKHSGFATGKLRDLQSQMNLPLLKVKQDVSTRWNSSLTMIERLLTIKIPLTASMSSLPRDPDCLNASEWEIISDCVNILKPFENITSELSGENYPTLSLVIPLIRGLQYMLKNLITETTIGNEFKNKLIDVVVRRLDHLEKDKIVAKSTFLDPRLKKTGFGLKENADNAHKWVCKELTSIIRAKNDNNEITESDTTEPTSSTNISANTYSVWKHFDDKIAQVKITSNPNATASIMIRQYLEIPPLNRKKNPLEF